ncbi:thiamine-phosphate kinase, partial [Candidatus Aerophobetes bacterium]|nr:thiamine-phosphate kinase [Candidatus Aerophobetes bacterium]
MDISEVELIKRIRDLSRPLQKKALVGIGDDAAVIEGREGYSYLLTTDTLVENVHFEWIFTHPHQLGWKAMAACTSDIAAMGGYPVFALVTLGVSTEAVFSTVKQIYEGMLDLSSRMDVEVSGGDIVRSPIFFISISVLGEVEAGRAILRKGASVGDSIYVTGEIGAAAAGLLFLKQSKILSVSSNKEKAVEKWLMPFPRIKEAREILKTGFATAMIDISDGLSSDLCHILEESKVGAEIWEEKIPLSFETQKLCDVLKKSAVEVALQG